MTKLLILRHGPTVWNAGHRLQGHTDIPLSDAGRALVRGWCLAPEFKGFQALSSPLCRAQETAQILGLDAHPEAALTEMSWGDWEGRTLSDLRARLGSEMAANEARGLDFRPPGGESPREVQERLKPWLKNVQKATVAVAHRGVIRALYALATGWDMCSPPPVRMDKFAAHLFSVDGQGQPRLDRLNIPLGGV